jgi:hypothetical protein
MEMEMQNQQSDRGSTADSGFWGKFINIYTNPSKTFSELIQRPTWLMPMIVILVLAMIVTYITFPIIMKSQVEMLHSNPNISAEQMKAIEAQIAERGDAQKYFALGAQVVVFPIIYLILAGIFYLVGSVILGGDSSFKKVLSVWSWSTMIGVLAMIVKTPLIFIKENARISISPALLLSGDAIDTTPYLILSQFDFFTIWQLAVFAVGFGMIYRFSTAKSYIAVGALWAIWIVISVAAHDLFRNLGLA